MALGGLLLVVTAAFLIYFPGRQSLLALALSSGIGIKGIQAKVDALEEKAIQGESFSDEDKAFLQDLYKCFAGGARVTIVLCQSAMLMDHYLSGSGEDLRLKPRIFLGSGKVREQISDLKKVILSDIRSRGAAAAEYATPSFYMGDPEFYDSYVGLYFGRLLVKTQVRGGGAVLLRWRAEMPWQWPSYQSLYEKYGDHHAQCFPLPNIRSIILGPQYSLRLDDGLGEHLVKIGLARPFLAFSDWDEEIAVPRN